MHEHKFPFKVMIWVEITFNGVTEIVILLLKTTFDQDFSSKTFFQQLKETETDCSDPNFILQQKVARHHTSKAITIQSIHKVRISLIGPDIWPLDSPDLNQFYCFFSERVRTTAKNKSFNKLKENLKKFFFRFNLINIDFLN